MTAAPTGTPPAEPPQRPANVPEKFWDAEKGVVKTDDLIASYTELETKQSAAPPAPPPPDPSQMKIQPQQTGPAFDSIDTILNRAGLKADDVAQEFQQSGRLTDAQYAALQSQGVGRTMVDMVMQGQHSNAQLLQMQRTQARTAAEGLTGGAGQLDNLLAWAANLPPNVQADLNERLADPQRYEGAVTELMGRHRTAVGAGTAEPLIEAGTGTPPGVGALTTKEEVTKALHAARNGDGRAQQQIMVAMQNGTLQSLLG